MPLLSAIALALVLALMWRDHRERWLGYWAIAAVLWAARYGYGLLSADLGYATGALLLPLLVLGRGYCLLAGAYALLGRAVPQGWRVSFWIIGGGVLWDVFVAPIVLWDAPGVPTYLHFGAATMWSAGLVARERATRGGGTWLVAAGLALLGAANATFPWASDSVELAPALFLVAGVSQLAIDFGTLLVYYRRALEERDQAVLRLESALAKALTGYLPICAHCKAIRATTGAWERIELYLMTHHDAAFTHGICPSCEREHYGASHP